VNQPAPDAIVETDDGIELQQSTELGAKGIFRRFVFVLVVLELIMGGMMLAYDIADNTASMREKLESVAIASERVTHRLREDLPEARDLDIVRESSRITGMPMGLVTHDGALLHTTEPAVLEALSAVYEKEPLVPSRRFAIRQDLGKASGGWFIRPFSEQHHLLIIVPHLPESEGQLMYVTISGGVLAVGLALSVLVMLTTANWMLRHPLDRLVQSLTAALKRDNDRRRVAEHVAVEARLDAEAHLAFLNNLINASDQVGIIAVDNDDRIQLLNRAAENTLGFSEEETVGKMTLTELLDRTRRRSVHEVPLRSLMKLQEGEVFVSDRSGVEHLVALNYSNIEDAEGKTKGRLMVFVDVTEQKRLEVELQINEMQLVQSAKLAGLGEMATGVAHELNQPLNNIGLLASRVARRLAKDEGDHDFELEKLQKVQGQVQRASKIIDQLRTFGRPSVLSVKDFPIRRPVEAVLDLLRQQFSSRGIDIQVDIPDGLPNVLADEPQLEQVLINLLNNARDALMDQGEANGSPRVRIKAEAELLPGDGELRICLHVQDNGPGMPEHVSRRVFEPFFSTKEVGKGTGLGLSISYGLVRGFGGTLAFRSNPGEGTTFTILLRTAEPYDGPISDDGIREPSQGGLVE
jgi:PAS domain S-box-containing protein